MISEDEDHVSSDSSAFRLPFAGDETAVVVVVRRFLNGREHSPLPLFESPAAALLPAPPDAPDSSLLSPVTDSTPDSGPDSRIEEADPASDFSDVFPSPLLPFSDLPVTTFSLPLVAAFSSETVFSFCG